MARDKSDNHGAVDSIVGLLQSLIATHNMDPAARMDRRVTIRDGQVTEMA